MSDDGKIAAGDRWTRMAIISWAWIGMLILLAAFLWLLGRVGSALTPVVVAFVIVFLLKSPVNRLQERGMGRALAVVVVFLAGTVLLGLLFVFIIPPLVGQIREFMEAFPGYYDRAYQIWLDVQAQYSTIEVPQWMQQAALDAKDEVVVQLTTWSRKAASGLFAAGGQVAGFLLNIVLAGVISFYLLKDLPRLRERSFALLPERKRKEARHLYCRVVGVLSGYLRGQIIISAVVGVLTFIGMAAIGVPFPLVIGLITGVFNIVPYLGPIVGATVAAISAAFVDPWLALWAALVILAIQQVDGLLISPRIMSEQVDLHPVLVIVSLLVGGTLLGFVGLLVAIPLAAATKGVLLYYLEEHGLWRPDPTGRRRAGWRMVRLRNSSETSDGDAKETGSAV